MNRIGTTSSFRRFPLSSKSGPLVLAGLLVEVGLGDEHAGLVGPPVGFGLSPGLLRDRPPGEPPGDHAPRGHRVGQLVADAGGRQVHGDAPEGLGGLGFQPGLGDLHALVPEVEAAARRRRTRAGRSSRRGRRSSRAGSGGGRRRVTSFLTLIGAFGALNRLGRIATVGSTSLIDRGALNWRLRRAEVDQLGSSISWSSLRVVDGPSAV